MTTENRRFAAVPKLPDVCHQETHTAAQHPNHSITSTAGPYIWVKCGHAIARSCPIGAVARAFWLKYPCRFDRVRCWGRARLPYLSQVWSR